MVVNDNAGSLTPHGALGFIASNRASTGCSYRGSRHQNRKPPTALLIELPASQTSIGFWFQA
jgi:hypothetical protein